MLRHGSLFSGIGGFDLAAEWAGWSNEFHCEFDEFNQRVLNYYWPNAISYGDIKETDFTEWRGAIDIISGGFPCQPFSLAGQRKGTEDDRHLWPEMLRAIREIQPSWIVGENVLGLVNWGGGMVFEQVQSDLEVEGYEVQPFILPACSKNAPHRRDRVWFVAYSNKHNDGRAARKNEGEGRKERLPERDTVREFIKPNKVFGAFTNAKSNGNIRALRQMEGENEKKPSQKKPRQDKAPVSGFNRAFTNTQRREREIKRKPSRVGREFQQAKGDSFSEFPSQSPFCGGNDGLPSELDGITFSKWRKGSIKAYGNAVVPQVPYEIFKAINAYKETQ